MRRIIAVILLGFASAAFPQTEEFPARMGLVNDFAKIMNLRERAAFQGELFRYKERTGYQIHAITIADRNGMKQEEYAGALVKSWRITDPKNVFVFLFVEKKSERVISTYLTTLAVVANEDDGSPLWVFKKSKKSEQLLAMKNYFFDRLQFSEGFEYYIHGLMKELDKIEKKQKEKP